MQLFKKSQAVICSTAIGIATLISCNNTHRQQQHTDTTHAAAVADSVVKAGTEHTTFTGADTTITTSIEGVSAEGSEVIASYRQGKITKAKWTVFGETGRSEINYTFMDSIVTAEEVRYTYKKPLMEVKSDKDIVMDSKQTYSIPLTGASGRTPFVKEDDGLFAIFKENVAFKL